MGNKDVRWIQRFNNYKKALARLTSAIELSEERPLSDLEQQGLIQAFEFTFDMAWKTLQDFVVEKGYEGKRDKPIPTIVEAARKTIVDEKQWRLIYQSRNKTSHSYDEEIAQDIAEKVIEAYHTLFIQLETRLQLEKINREKQGLKFGLDDKVIEDIQKVFQDNWKVDAVVLFGSRAKGNYRERSDIDLAVKGRNITFDDILSLSSKLDDLNLPYEIDLINYSSIKDEDVIEHIDRVGIVFYERWKEYKFTDFVEINPVVKFHDKKKVSFIEMKDLSYGDRNCYPSIERELTGGARFENDDTLFARITPCLENGKINQVKGLKDGVGFGSTEFLVFRGKKNISNKDFVFYLLRWDEVRDYAERHFEGTSGRQRVPKDCFDNLFLNFPPLKEQESIASILSALDDKIDLLHRQNKTLEQLVETLFRQWFVEEASEDWETGKLGDVISVKGRTTPSTAIAENWNGNIHWTSPRDLTNSNSIFLFDTERKITDKGLTQIGSGLLPVGTVLLSSRAPIGYLAITEIPVAINQGYIAIICDKGVSNHFIYVWCKANMSEIENAGNGSVFQEISKSTFRELNFKIPPKKKLLQFDYTVESIFKKIKSNITQINSLVKLRDALLPKLMSGEVRVKM